MGSRRGIWMRAASSAPVGGRAVGAAGAASADIRVLSGWGAGGAGERCGRRLGAGRLAVGGESRQVGLAGREAVEAGVLVAQRGDVQLGAPEVLAPALSVVAGAVGVDEVAENVGGVAALREHL